MFFYWTMFMLLNCQWWLFFLAQTVCCTLCLIYCIVFYRSWWNKDSYIKIHIWYIIITLLDRISSIRLIECVHCLTGRAFDNWVDFGRLDRLRPRPTYSINVNFSWVTHGDSEHYRTQKTTFFVAGWLVCNYSWQQMYTKYIINPRWRFRRYFT